MHRSGAFYNMRVWTLLPANELIIISPSPSLESRIQGRNFFYLLSPWQEHFPYESLAKHKIEKFSLSTGSRHNAIDIINRIHSCKKFHEAEAENMNRLVFPTPAPSMSVAVRQRVTAFRGDSEADVYFLYIGSERCHSNCRHQQR